MVNIVDSLILIRLDIFAHHSTRKDTEHLKIPLRDIRLATDSFSERYLIGKGAYSMVYKCKLPNTKNDVVIKRILEDTQAEQLFLEEIEMLTKCKHPNIISLLGLCYEGGHMILVLEYASKGSLDDLLEDSDRMNSFTWDQRIQICLDIAHGLNYLHTGMDDKNVIIHRDVKSANILLDENGKAKIADFGLSKLRSSYEKDNTLNTNSSKPRPLNASNHEELHDIAPSYGNIDSNLPPSDANFDPSYGNIDSNLTPSTPTVIRVTAILTATFLRVTPTVIRVILLLRIAALILLQVTTALRVLISHIIVGITTVILFRVTATFMV